MMLSNLSLAKEPIFKLSPSSSGHTIPLYTNSSETLHHITDNGRFYLYYQKNIEIYDLNTGKITQTLNSGYIAQNNSKFLYMDDSDSTVYYSSGDSNNVYLVKTNLNNITKSDTLIIGPKSYTILYYLSYDRKTVYSYQSGVNIQAIDLSTMKITYSQAALDYIQVNNFAIDENLKIIHLGTYYKYLALDMNTMKEFYSLEYPGTSFAKVNISPNGEAAVLLTNYNLGYGITNAKIIDIPNKTIKKSLDDFASGASAKFLTNDEVFFNVSSFYSCIYNITLDSFIYTGSRSTIIQPIKYNGQNALFCWEASKPYSIKDPYKNKLLMNYANSYNPIALLGDTVILKNHDNLEYWNMNTQSRLLDTLSELGRITGNGKAAIHFSNGRLIRRNLSNLEVTSNSPFPFNFANYTIIGIDNGGTKLFVAKDKCKDTTIEFDISTGKCLDTFSLIRDVPNWMPYSSNTLKYYNSQYKSGTIYKYKSNDTLLQIPQTLKVVFASDDRFIAVIDSSFNFYTIDTESLNISKKVHLPIYYKSTYGNVDTPYSLFISNDNNYAYVYASTLNDTIKSTVIWKINISTSMITQTFIIENDANTLFPPTLTHVSDSGKHFVLAVNGYIYAYYFNYTDSDAEVKPVTYTNSSIRIFPQPASDFITVKSNNGIIKSIKIFDNNGKIILNSGAIGSEILEISTINMAKGVYHFSLETENSTESGNFVIN